MGEARDMLVVVRPLKREPVEVVLGVPGCPRIHFYRLGADMEHLIEITIERLGATIERFMLTAPEQKRFMAGLASLGLSTPEDAVSRMAEGSESTIREEKSSSSS